MSENLHDSALKDLLRRPFAKARGRHRSVDKYDHGSGNYVGFRMLDVDADLGAHEAGAMQRNQAQSVAELLCLIEHSDENGNGD